MNCKCFKWQSIEDVGSALKWQYHDICNMCKRLSNIVYRNMSHGITQWLLKRQLQYHIHRSAISSDERSVCIQCQCSMILERKHTIKTCKITNKGIHVNELNCPKHAVHVPKEQKKIFLNKKNQNSMHSSKNWTNANTNQYQYLKKI